MNWAIYSEHKIRFFEHIFSRFFLFTNISNEGQKSITIKYLCQAFACLYAAAIKKAIVYICVRLKFESFPFSYCFRCNAQFSAFDLWAIDTLKRTQRQQQQHQNAIDANTVLNIVTITQIPSHHQLFLIWWGSENASRNNNYEHDEKENKNTNLSISIHSKALKLTKEPKCTHRNKNKTIINQIDTQTKTQWEWIQFLCVWTNDDKVYKSLFIFLVHIEPHHPLDR